MPASKCRHNMSTLRNAKSGLWNSSWPWALVNAEESPTKGTNRWESYPKQAAPNRVVNLYTWGTFCTTEAGTGVVFTWHRTWKNVLGILQNLREPLWIYLPKVTSQCILLECNTGTFSRSTCSISNIYKYIYIYNFFYSSQLDARVENAWRSLEPSTCIQQ